MANNGHSRLAPSAAHRWAYCTASIHFIEQLKLPYEDDSPYAEEGTAAHVTFAKSLAMKNPFEVKYGTEQEEIYLPEAIEYVLNLQDKYPGAPLLLEKRVNPAKFVRTRHCKGTADVILPVDLGPLYVIDLKFGEHVAVDAGDNLQLLLYALGSLAEFPDYIFTEIVMVILQPRARHKAGTIRTWTISIEDAMEWADWLARRAKEALNPEKALFRPDPEHVCRFCPAKGVCRALAEYELKVARDIFTDISEPLEGISYKNIERLTNIEMSHLLQEFTGIRRWMTEVSAAALRYLQNGGTMPHYKIVESLSNRTWSIPPEELEEYFPEEVLYERIIRSPAQVEKVLGKKSVDKFTTREIKGNTLKYVEADETEVREETVSMFGDIDDD